MQLLFFRKAISVSPKFCYSSYPNFTHKLEINLLQNLARIKQFSNLAKFASAIRPLKTGSNFSIAEWSKTSVLVYYNLCFAQLCYT